MKDINVLLVNGVDVKKSLELFGDMETYDETLEVFLSDIDSRLGQLKTYKEVADTENYAILVHSLKSDMCYFGFESLMDICYQHELASKANNIYFIYEHYDELVKEMKNMIRIASEYLGKNVVIELERATQVIPTNESILVVDDSNIIRSFIQKVFYNKYHTLIANDGEEALNLIKNTDHYIVGMLLDLNMPNVDGFAVLDYFKAKNLFSKIPVSIITGVGDDESVKKALSYPIVYVLRKPFNERDIKSVVEKTIMYSK